MTGASCDARLTTEWVTHTWLCRKLVPVQKVAPWRVASSLSAGGIRASAH